MAEAKQNSRSSKFQTFCSGVQEEYLGVVRNAVINRVKSEGVRAEQTVANTSAENQTFFTQRPSFGVQPINTATGSLVSANDLTFATTSNMYSQCTYVMGANPQISIGTAFVPGSANHTYFTRFMTSGRAYAPILNHNYTATNRELALIADSDCALLYNMDITNSTTGFVKQPYNLQSGSGSWVWSNVSSASPNVMNFYTTTGQFFTNLPTTNTTGYRYVMHVFVQGNIGETFTISLSNGTQTFTTTATISYIPSTTSPREYYSLITDTFTSDGTLNAAVIKATGNTITTATFQQIQVYRFASTTGEWASGDSTQLTFSPIPHMVSMDGYLFIAEQNTDTIHNSTLNDINTWDTSVNLIRASQFPGRIQALARINNYVVALKDTSIEFFYNGGLTSTSPLQRNTSYTKMVGLSVPSSLTSINNSCYFIGCDSFGSRKVYKLTETTCESISTKWIDELLSLYTPKISADVNNDVFMRSFYFATGNKKFYILNMSLLSGPVCVYDIDEDVWGFWDGIVPINIVHQTKDHPEIGQAAFCWSRNPVNSSQVTPVFASYGGTALNYVTKDTVPGYGSGYDPIVVTLKCNPTDLGSGNRKFINEVSCAVFSPTNVTHTITMDKFSGDTNATISVSGTNKNNLNFKNWGQAIIHQLTYSVVDTTSGVGQPAQSYRFYGLQTEYTTGVS